MKMRWDGDYLMAEMPDGITVKIRPGSSPGDAGLFVYEGTNEAFVYSGVPLPGEGEWYYSRVSSFLEDHPEVKKELYRKR